MQRQHKSCYHSSEGLRQIQAQINELWGVVGAVQMFSDARQLEAAGDLRVVKSPPTDPLALPALTTSSPTHAPQSFKVIHTGRGWYQVVDAEGKAIHEGRLRKGPADEAWEAAMAVV